MVETFVQSTDDVVKFLEGQHNLIKDMFDDVLSASSDEARQTAFQDLRQLLAVHETAEEMVVHPGRAARSTVATTSSMLGSKRSTAPRPSFRSWSRWTSVRPNSWSSSRTFSKP